MYGWEQRAPVKHYLEQGLTKAAIAERVGVSHRTIHYWLASGGGAVAPPLNRDP
jgi:transposase